MIALLIGLSNLFVYCYFGKLATDSFFKMSDCLYNANWHALPIKLQKYFILMIQHSQQPLSYHGFKMVIFNLETFMAVSIINSQKQSHFIEHQYQNKMSGFYFQFLKAVYTYYMALETITNWMCMTLFGLYIDWPYRKQWLFYWSFFFFLFQIFWYFLFYFKCLNNAHLI